MFSKDFLEQEYVINKKSCPRISRETGCNARTIHSWLVKYGIPRRDNSNPAYKKDMLGVKVGNLEVIGQSKISKANQATWIVRCNRCGVFIDLPGWKIRHRRTGGCENCGRKHNYRGYKDISKSYWNRVTVGAKDRNLECSISIEEAWNIYEKQDRKCALSGIPIFFDTRQQKTSEKTASLDRIDNSKGYIPGNVQWLHKDVNKLKGTFSDDFIIDIAHKISAYRQEQKN